MATCLPFLRVPDVRKTMEWYTAIGLICLGIHQEPGREQGWALLYWDGALNKMVKYCIIWFEFLIPGITEIERFKFKDLERFCF